MTIPDYPLAMRPISLIVVHCSATREGKSFTAADLRAMHTRKPPAGRGWSDIGYHHVIELDGKVQPGRSEAVPGAHVTGFNSHSIGVCYIGGLDDAGRPKDTRTPDQTIALQALLIALRHRYPTAHIRGHRDMSPDLNGNGVIEPREWLKACPCFDVVAWCHSVGIDPL